MKLKDIPNGYLVYEHMNINCFGNVVKIVCPEEIANHPILVKNIKDLPVNAYRWLECKKVYERNVQAAKELFFDIEKQKHYAMMSKIIEEQLELEKEINRDISPYKWKIIEDTTDREVICLLIKKDEVDE